MSWKCKLGELEKAISADVLVEKSLNFDGFSTDSRKIHSGDIFVALQGDSFDGHHFLQQAIESGAKCLIVHEWDQSLTALAEESLCSVLKVEDTLIALQKWANYWRRKFDVFVVGITGTNGKTSTKEFLNQILKDKYSVQYSKGSFNNHWGVPISLLQLDGTQSIMICEMGMNNANEIKDLVEIALPDLVCVTNVGYGHIENLGSIEAVAAAKEEIYKYSSSNSKRVFNLVNPYTKSMKNRYVENSISFGTDSSEVNFKTLKHSVNGLQVDAKILIDSYTIEIPVVGVHNVENLMAATALALQCGMSPREISISVKNCRTIWGRNQLVSLSSGASAIFDGYNANPESMKAFLELVKDLKPSGNSYLILGDMLELGKDSEKIHTEFAKEVANMDFQEMLYIGDFCDVFEQVWRSINLGKKSVFLSTYEESLAIPWKDMLQPSDAVFVKASRGIGLERALRKLEPVDF